MAEPALAVRTPLSVTMELALQVPPPVVVILPLNAPPEP